MSLAADCTCSNSGYWRRVGAYSWESQ